MEERTVPPSEILTPGAVLDVQQKEIDIIKPSPSDTQKTSRTSATVGTLSTGTPNSQSSQSYYQRDEQFHAGLKKAAQIRRRLSIERDDSPNGLQDMGVARALNAAATAFCNPSSTRRNLSFFDAAIELATREQEIKSHSDFNKSQAKDSPVMEESKDWSLPELVGVLVNRSRNTIVRQQDEILCLRITIRELLREILDSEGNQRNRSEKFPDIIEIEQDGDCSRQSKSVDPRESGKSPSAIPTPFTPNDMVRQIPGIQPAGISNSSNDREVKSDKSSGIGKNSHEDESNDENSNLKEVTRALDKELRHVQEREDSQRKEQVTSTSEKKLIPTSDYPRSTDPSLSVISNDNPQNIKDGDSANIPGNATAGKIPDNLISQSVDAADEGSSEGKPPLSIAQREVEGDKELLCIDEPAKDVETSQSFSNVESSGTGSNSGVLTMSLSSDPPAEFIHEDSIVIDTDSLKSSQLVEMKGSEMTIVSAGSNSSSSVDQSNCLAASNLHDQETYQDLANEEGKLQSAFLKLGEEVPQEVKPEQVTTKTEATLDQSTQKVQDSTLTTPTSTETPEIRNDSTTNIDKQFAVPVPLTKQKSFDPPAASDTDIEVEETEDSHEGSESATGRRMVVLLSSTPISRKQETCQERALIMLKVSGIEVEIVDGSDPDEEELRGELFALSGLHGVYPQFFVSEDTGATEFFGDFDALDAMNENGELREAFLKLGEKTPDTFVPSTSVIGELHLGVEQSQMETSGKPPRVEAFSPGKNEGDTDGELRVGAEQIHMETSGNSSLIEAFSPANNDGDGFGEGEILPTLESEQTFSENIVDIQKCHNASSNQSELRMVVLLSTATPISRKQESCQERSLVILKANGIEAEVVDHADPDEQSLGEQLFGLSGTKDLYPQFFVTEDSGATQFFGDFDLLDQKNEEGELLSYFLFVGGRPLLGPDINAAAPAVHVEEEKKDEAFVVPRTPDEGIPSTPSTPNREVPSPIPEVENNSPAESNPGVGLEHTPVPLSPSSRDSSTVMTARSRMADDGDDHPSAPLRKPGPPESKTLVPRLKQELALPGDVRPVMFIREVEYSLMDPSPIYDVDDDGRLPVIQESPGRRTEAPVPRAPVPRERQGNIASGKIQRSPHLLEIGSDRSGSFEHYTDGEEEL